MSKTDKNFSSLKNCGKFYKPTKFVKFDRIVGRREAGAKTLELHKISQLEKTWNPDNILENLPFRTKFNKILKSRGAKIDD